MSRWTDKERAAMLQWTMEDVIHTIQEHGEETRLEWVANRLEAALDEYGEPEAGHPKKREP